MLNSKPNNSKYRQGNYKPKYADKVLKLNGEGGLYYRSGMELQLMVYFDNNPNIIRWGAECLKIPYQLTHYNNYDTTVKDHSYYPDFYYELKNSDGIIKHVVVEVKPYKEYKMVQDLNEGRLTMPEGNIKKLRNFEYDFKMANKNNAKWQNMIEWCNKKGYEFIIVTEHQLKMFK